ncbi:MAG: hypothetical protein FWG59_00045, partial [Betaproteobacteria bacterium]|nr:hypothetical protein [Betaproteobacteria bacterium]
MTTIGSITPSGKYKKTRRRMKATHSRTMAQAKPRRPQSRSLTPALSAQVNCAYACAAASH